MQRAIRVGMKQLATTHPNDHGGMDTIIRANGANVRTTFEDGTTYIYVLDSRGVHHYEATLTHLTPLALVQTVLDGFLNVFGIRGAECNELVTKIMDRRNAAIAAWRKENNF